MAFDHEFGAERFLVRVRHSGEITDFAFQRLAIESLDIAFDQGIERAFDINLEKPVVLSSDLVTDLAIRRDCSRNCDDAVAGEQPTYVANPANIGITIFLGKTQA